MAIRNYWRTGPNNYTINLLPIGDANLGNSSTPFQEGHFDNLNVYDPSNNPLTTEFLGISQNNQVIKTTNNSNTIPRSWEEVDDSPVETTQAALFPCNNPNYILLMYEDTDIVIVVIDKTTMDPVSPGSNNLILQQGSPVILHRDRCYVLNKASPTNLIVFDVDNAGIISVLGTHAIADGDPGSIYVNDDPYDNTKILAVVSLQDPGFDAFEFYDVTNPAAITNVVVNDIPKFEAYQIYFETSYVYVYNVANELVEIYQIDSSYNCSSVIQSISASNITMSGTTNEYGHVLYINGQDWIQSINRVGSSFIINKLNDVGLNTSGQFMQQYPVIDDYLFSSDSSGKIYVFNNKRANSALPILLTRFATTDKIFATGSNVLIDDQFTIFQVINLTGELTFRLKKWDPVW